MTEPLGPDYNPDDILPVGPDKDARMWAVVAHLSPLLGWVIPYAGNIILPLIVWLIKREESPFIDDQAKEAVNFQITVTIAMTISTILMFVCIGFLLMLVVGIGALVLMVLAAIQANNGVPYRYPFTLRLIK
ncbi:MAG: DUF4870 domain-containing protein [FCB group bacterium]|jgi:uncharacterized Tic20 family protein|nr:DUF4870 domain-containing protein [FCB group bacterium]